MWSAQPTHRPSTRSRSPRGDRRQPANRRGAGGRGHRGTALRALTKLQQVLPQRLGRRVDALQSHTVRVTGARRGPQVDGTALAVIAAAAWDREILRFHYSDHAGSGTERRVEPYRLVSYGRRWYLVAFDLERDDWRTFRMDRLSEQRTVGHRFALRPLPADDLAFWLGVLDADFEVVDSPELVAAVQQLADRYARAAGSTAC